ncbi:hypothetical protein EC991_007522 [Linnemannia zychae]|nr:hypothetical protein EC991_007522 [Linnemannia zychae]
MKYNPLKKQYIKTTVVVLAGLTAFGFFQFYLYTDSESEKIHLPRLNAVEASFESRRPLTVPITIVTAASGNHACALEAFLYHMEKTLALLQTDPEEDRRRAEEKAQAGREYLEMSPDLDDIRKTKKPFTVVGKNGDIRKAKVTNNDDNAGAGGDSNGEGTVGAAGGGGGEDQDMVEEKKAEAEHTRIRRSSRQQQHRRQLNADSIKSEDGEGGGEDEVGEDANSPQNVESDQGIADLQHSTPDRQSSSRSSSEEGNSAEIKFEIRPRVVVYNMGMGPTKRKKRIFQALVEAGYIDQPLDFDFQKHPDFWRLGTETRGEYGWKAGIIEEVSQRILSTSSPEMPPADLGQQLSGSGPFSSNTTNSSTSTEPKTHHQPGIVLWLDSGDRISLPFLRWLPSFLLQNGMWSPQSQDDMLTWTHPGLLDYYHDSLKNYSPGETNCNGAAMAFDVRNHTVRNGIMREWVHCARTKECIAPEGSSRANHRQDQAALTYLVKRMGYGKELCHGMPDVFDIQVNQDRFCKEEIAAEPNRVVYR